MRYVTATFLLLSLCFVMFACFDAKYNSGDATTDVMGYLKDCYKEADLENTNLLYGSLLGLNVSVIEENILSTFIKAVQNGEIKPDEDYLGNGIWEVSFSADLYSDNPFIDSSIPLEWSEDHLLLYLPHSKGGRSSVEAKQWIRSEYYPGYPIVDVFDNKRLYYQTGITIAFEEEEKVHGLRMHSSRTQKNNDAVENNETVTRFYSRDSPPLRSSLPKLRSLIISEEEMFYEDPFNYVSPLTQGMRGGYTTSEVSTLIHEYLSDTEQLSGAKDIHIVKRGQNVDAYPYLIHEIDFKWKIYENAILTQEDPKLANNNKIISISDALKEYGPEYAEEDLFKNGPAILWGTSCLLDN